MKITLDSRKSVRLNWFKQENVPYSIMRELELSYTLDSISQDLLYQTIKKHYMFSTLTQPIPETKIILFDEELPRGYLSTKGSIGDKISTENDEDLDMKVTDRIMKLDQGEEKITTRPVPPAEAHIYKEIQVRERRDKIKRKISIKNDTDKLIKEAIVTFIETKEITFVDSAPKVSKSAPPEYKWSIEIPAGATVSIELQVETYTKTTYKIEKEKPMLAK
nr:hypothetical protein [Candidatus Sigynarchaeota archaeon]